MEVSACTLVVDVHAVQPPTDHAPKQVLSDSENCCFLAFAGLRLSRADEQVAFVERDELLVMAHPGEWD